MKKLIFLTLEDGTQNALYNTLEEFKKTKILKNYELIISNKKIDPLNIEQTLQLCGMMLKCAEKMIK